MAYQTMTDLATDDLVTETEFDKIKNNCDFLHDRKVTICIKGATLGTLVAVGDWISESVNNANNTQSWYYAFVLPDDFSSLDSCEIAVVATAASFTMEYDLNSDYFNPDNSETITSGSESSVNQTLALTQNVPKLISAAGVLAGVAAGDFISVKLTSSTGVAGVWNPLVMRLVYTRT